MVGPTGPQTDAGPVIQPKTASLWLLLGNSQPLTPPDPPYPLGIHMPAPRTQERSHTPIAITAIRGSQSNERPCQRIFVVTDNQPQTLGRAMLAHHPAGPPFRYTQDILNMFNGSTATLRA